MVKGGKPRFSSLGGGREGCRWVPQGKVLGGKYPIFRGNDLCTFSVSHIYAQRKACLCGYPTMQADTSITWFASEYRQ